MAGPDGLEPPTLSLGNSCSIQTELRALLVNLVFDQGDDVLIGSPRPDVMDGGPHDDTIAGYEGSDQISGGSGDDRLFGGAPDAIADVSSNVSVTGGANPTIYPLAIPAGEAPSFDSDSGLDGGGLDVGLFSLDDVDKHLNWFSQPRRVQLGFSMSF